MRCPKRRVLWALALLTAGLSMPLASPACELVLTEHRSGVFLMRLPLNSTLPAADIAFTHSVLGTPVLDRYVWRFGPHGWLAHLIEERFEGEGYGLPTQAAAGERLERYGAGSRLLLNRVVDPLVVLPLPAQSMRIVLPDQREFLLGQLSLKSIEIRAENCPVP